MPRERGLLIINADDLGYRPRATDAILESFDARGISSASGMVFMEDSERAASLALDRGLPTGLHLNLAEPFTGGAVPEDVRARQARLARYFRSGFSHAMIWFPNPFVRSVVARAIQDQLEGFRALYGGDPSHVDGHRHLHLSPNVLLSRALPRDSRVRRGFTFLPGECPAPSRAVRRARNALVDARFRSTDYFFDLRAMHPQLAGSGLEDKLARAQHATVEVMTHPEQDDERDLLVSADWRRQLERVLIGSYLDL